ncbi:MAG: DUF4177 domain-containing protein [bacterium]|nr:DUF4177 domain-containing protein [bacterium]
MSRRFEYKFERIGEGVFAVKKAAKKEYQEIVHEHARQGWKLVQIFAPGIAAYGSAKYYEMIFEKEK